MRGIEVFFALEDFLLLKNMNQKFPQKFLHQVFASKKEFEYLTTHKTLTMAYNDSFLKQINYFSSLFLGAPVTSPDENIEAVKKILFCNRCFLMLHSCRQHRHFISSIPSNFGAYFVYEVCSRTVKIWPEKPSYEHHSRAI